MIRPTRPWSQAELVGALQAGDEQAFELVVRRHGGRLLAATRRLLQNEEDARDSVQEAFLQAFRRIGQFEGHADLRTWLHRIAINQALMKLRARTRRREGPIDHLEGEFDRLSCRIEPSVDVRETVDEMLARRQTCAEVMTRIAELPEHLRIVLMLRDIEELSTREVAGLLDLSEGQREDTPAPRAGSPEEALGTAVEGGSAMNGSARLKRLMKGVMLRATPGMITCAAFDAFIVDYLDGRLTPKEQRIFERHLRVCRECRDYLDAYRRTIETGKKAFAVGEAPVTDVPDDLVAAILAARPAPRGGAS